MLVASKLVLWASNLDKYRESSAECVLEEMAIISHHRNAVDLSMISSKHITAVRIVLRTNPIKGELVGHGISWPVFGSYHGPRLTILQTESTETNRV